MIEGLRNSLALRNTLIQFGILVKRNVYVILVLEAAQTIPVAYNGRLFCSNILDDTVHDNFNVTHSYKDAEIR